MCEAWYSATPKALEEFNNSIPSRNEDLIKVKGGATNADFIGSMHTAMLLCFHWNVLKYAGVCFIGMYLIFKDKCCLIIR